MIPDSSYPESFPFTESAALRLAGRLGELDSIKGAFLTFVMIPVEERVGEWRFAGACDSLGRALRRIDGFAAEMGLTEEGGESALRGWIEAGALEVWTDMKDAWSYTDLPLRDVGEHRVVLLGEGQAPYDHLGFAVLEIETLKGSPFADRAPETARPKQWDQEGGGELDDEEDDDG